MSQRQIIINAYPLLACGPQSYTVEINLQKSNPSRRFPIQTVADCKAALAAFAAELQATSNAWRLSVSFDKKSGRKPSGYDAADRARELECNVNPQLAPPSLI